jgi:histidine triad (HIT) family protein
MIAPPWPGRYARQTLSDTGFFYKILQNGAGQVKIGSAAMMTENIFQKIIDKEIPAKIAFEDDLCVAFHDIHPQAPVHVLIVPRKVIPTHADVADADKELLGHLHLVANRLAQELGLADGYRLVINCKERAGQTVPHLHIHLLGGRIMNWPPG